MSTDAQKLLYLQDTKEKIKTALELVLGHTISPSVPFRAYADQIRAVGGVLPDGEDITGYYEIPNSMPQQGTLTQYISRTGQLFWTCSSTTFRDTGIWRFNRTTRTFQQVYVGAGYGWVNFRETVNGQIFVSSNNIDTQGILWWNGTNFFQVYPNGYNWINWMQSSKGVLVSSSINNAACFGILRWTGSGFTQLKADGYNLKGWPDGQGNIVVNGATNVVNATYGIWVFDGTNLVQKLNNPDPGYNFTWLYSFRATNGDVFLSGTANANMGIYRWNSSTQALEHAKDTGYGFISWFEDSPTSIFCSSQYNVAATQGLWHWDGTAFNQIFNTGYYWVGTSTPNSNIYPETPANSPATGWVNSFPNAYPTGVGAAFKAATNRIFFSIPNTTYGAAGILYWNGASCSQVFNEGMVWTQWFTAPDGTVFTSSTTAPTDIILTQGLLRFDGTVFQRVIPDGYSYNCRGATHDNKMFIGSNGLNTAVGLWLWDGSSVTKVWNEGYAWRGPEPSAVPVTVVAPPTILVSTSKGTFLSSYAVGNMEGILRWDGLSLSKVWDNGYFWGFLDESGGNLRISSYMDFGRLEWDDSIQKFKVQNTFFGGRKFGKFRVPVITGMSQFIYLGDYRKSLDSFYSTIIAPVALYQTTDFAMNVTGSRSKILYTDQMT